MKHTLIFGIALLILSLSACAAPPIKVSSSPTVQNTTTPTRTSRPAPAITATLTGTRSPTATPDRRKVDPGLVYGEPCKAPCWFGLVPGKTTLQELLEIVPRLSTIDSPYDFPKEEGLVPEIIRTRLGTATHVYIYIEMDWDKKVLKSINSSTLNFNYPLSQLITQFGEPETVVDTEPGTKIAEPCKEWTSLEESASNGSAGIILYPRQGLLFTVHVPTTMHVRSGDIMLCPEMHVLRFCYYPPMTLQEALMDNRLADLCGKGLERFITEENLVKWHGYGSGY